MLIDIFNMDNHDDLEKEIADLKNKIETYPMPNVPTKLTEALAEKEVELERLVNKKAGKKEH